MLITAGLSWLAYRALAVTGSPGWTARLAAQYRVHPDELAQMLRAFGEAGRTDWGMVGRASVCFALSLVTVLVGFACLMHG